ncbi:MAG TPA: GNAT family N-acetyltransferase [Thermoplasmata archaeon]|nr:GNAT family N-acetyltransferase [Thermoplasmata archaeon]
MDSATDGPNDTPLAIAPLATADELPSALLPKLTSFFSAFLPLFVEETIRTGGTVSVATGPDGTEGLFLRRESERIGTIFARTRSSAEALYDTRGGCAVYCEYRLDPDALAYPVYSVDLPAWRPERGFRHRVRFARTSDLPAVLHLLREVYGSLDDAWFRAPASPAEHCFIAEVGGNLAGAAWITLVGGEGRLHTLSVAPRYRNLGVGHDLWGARVLFAQREGVRRVLTEIAETNAASRAISAAGGMRRIGQLFEHRR